MLGNVVEDCRSEFSGLVHSREILAGVQANSLSRGCAVKSVAQGCLRSCDVAANLVRVRTESQPWGT